jgi:UDP-N-acetylmuramoyl-tripeptide--D-alanyl-D-alanine ligase
MMRTLSELARACNGELKGADAAFAGVVIDSRKLNRGDLFVALAGEHTDGHEFLGAAEAAGAAGALISQERDAALPLVRVSNVEQALTAAAHHWRSSYHGPLIGVAGSNGKTTVKEMLASILAQQGECLATRGNLNNHLGVPLTLLGLKGSERTAVIEIGANRAGEVASLMKIAQPTVGLITNAGAEHLEGFGSLEGVARAEGEMVAGLDAAALAVINADDPFAPLWRSLTKARVVTFGLSPQADVRAVGVRMEVSERGFATHFRLHASGGTTPIQLALAGTHNVRNALAAAAAALGAGATLEQVARGLTAMRAVNGRLKFLQGQSGAWIVDDSYNANPSSVQAAIEVLAGLSGRRWLVFGDMAELGVSGPESHREIGRLARARGIERLYTFGSLAALAADAFGAGAERYMDMQVLIGALAPALKPDVRLLIKGSRCNRLERVVSAVGIAPDARRAG